MSKAFMVLDIPAGAMGVALAVAFTLSCSAVAQPAYETAELDEWLARNETNAQLARAIKRLPQEMFSESGRPVSLEEALEMLDNLEGDEEQPGWIQSLAGTAAQCPISTLKCGNVESSVGAQAPREELLRLAKTAVSVLAVQSNCAAAANLLNDYSDVHRWRGAELSGKAWMESNVASCFQRSDETVAAAEHYRLSLCASSYFDPGFVAAQGLARIAFESKQAEDAHAWLDCAEDMLQVELRQAGPSKEVLAYMVDLSATILNWFGDLSVFETIHHDVERYLEELLREARGAERAELFQLQAGVYADALEVYITKNDDSRARKVYARLIEQPYVPSYLAVIIRAIFATHLVKRGEHDAAHRVAVDMQRRYQDLPEFAEYWDWQLFMGWLDDDTRGSQQGVNEMARMLAKALDSDKSTETSRDLKQFVDWLGRLRS